MAVTLTKYNQLVNIKCPLLNFESVLLTVKTKELIQKLKSLRMMRKRVFVYRAEIISMNIFLILHCMVFDMWAIGQSLGWNGNPQMEISDSGIYYFKFKHKLFSVHFLLLCFFWLFSCPSILFKMYG